MRRIHPQMNHRFLSPRHHRPILWALSACMCILGAMGPAAARAQGQADRSNVFDPARATWPDRVPLPAPPPPPPPPPPVTDDDLQLYGVMIVGSEKKAMVRLGKRFAAANPASKAFVTLSEGQSLGEFTLAQVLPNRVVLASGPHQQNILFSKKTDRPAPGAAAPVVQGPSQPGPDGAQVAAARPTTLPAPVAAQAAPGSSPQVAPAVVQPSVNTNVDTSAVLQNAPPGSLAAAIAAAQQAAAQRPAGASVPSTFNPFMQRP